METTERLKLPLLVSGQSDKETFHNEALTLLDCLLGSMIDDSAGTTPPASPIQGLLYLIAPGATGPWLGHTGELAAWTAGGWRFVTPVPGLRFVHALTGVEWVFGVAGWNEGDLAAARLVIDGKKVVGVRQSAIAEPSGGAAADSEAREALAQILTAMRNHGLIET